MRIAAERLLYLQCQAVHAFPHVGPADRQPHPNTARNRDHRRASALMTAEARSAGIEPGMRTRALPENSISIADALHLASCAAGFGCQSALNFDPRSASNRDPSWVLVQACPGSEREGPA